MGSDRGKSIYLTIAAESFANANTISRNVAEVSKHNSDVGELFTDSHTSLQHPLDKKEYVPFSLIRPLVDFIDYVSESPEGEATTFNHSSFICPFQGFAANREGMEKGNPVSLYYALNVNRFIEDVFGVSKFKDKHPLAVDSIFRQEAMGYLIEGPEGKADKARDDILAVAKDNPQDKAILTFNQVAFIKEALTEIKYHVGMAMYNR